MVYISSSFVPICFAFCFVFVFLLFSVASHSGGRSSHLSSTSWSVPDRHESLICLPVLFHCISLSLLSLLFVIVQPFEREWCYGRMCMVNKSWLFHLRSNFRAAWAMLNLGILPEVTSGERRCLTCLCSRGEHAKSSSTHCFRHGVSLTPARGEWFHESLGVSHSCRVLWESSLLSEERVKRCVCFAGFWQGWKFTWRGNWCEGNLRYPPEVSKGPYVARQWCY